MTTSIHHGAVRFKRDVFPVHADHFRSLKDGQTPKILFITCSDSRLLPSLLTQAGPGDLFVMRNAGNIVPAWGAGDLSSAATIEYAMDVLKVEHAIVCGHSHCGAMAAVLDPSQVLRLPAVSAWLDYATSVRRVVDARKPPAARRSIEAVERNVVAQLDNLRTHPSVAARVASGELSLVGWVYHFEEGHVDEYVPATDKFVSLESLVEPPRQLAAV